MLNGVKFAGAVLIRTCMAVMSVNQQNARRDYMQKKFSQELLLNLLGDMESGNCWIVWSVTRMLASFISNIR